METLSPGVYTESSALLQKTKVFQKLLLSNEVRLKSVGSTLSSASDLESRL